VFTTCRNDHSGKGRRTIVAGTQSGSRKDYNYFINEKRLLAFQLIFRISLE
jgi:hypothetical protein